MRVDLNCVLNDRTIRVRSQRLHPVRLRRQLVVRLAGYLVVVAALPCLPDRCLAERPTQAALVPFKDRLVFRDSPGQRELNAATQVTAVSPAASDALPGDLVIERDDLVQPQRMVLVIRKPRGKRITYQFPPPPKQGVFQYLQQHLERAQELGANYLRFPKQQTLRIRSPRANSRHLALEGFRDATIDLNGCTLLFARLSMGCVIKDCQRLVLCNGTLKSEALLSTVARVQPYVANKKGTTPNAALRFEVLPVFRQPLLDAFAESPNPKPTLLTVGNVREVGKSWRFDAVGAVDLFTNRNPRVDRFSYHVPSSSFRAVSPSARQQSSFAMQQLVYLLHRNNAAHGILMKNSDSNVEDITLEHLRLKNIPGMAIVGEVNRGLHLKNVTVSPDEENPLSFWGSSSDGVHINNNGGDVVVEDSSFTSSADDFVNIKGNYWRVQQIDREAKTAVVVPADRKVSVHVWGRAGDRVVAIDNQFQVLGTAKLIRPAAKLKSRTFQLALDSLPRKWVAGCLIANPDLAGGRVVIRNNHFANTRAQGVVVGTSHTVIERNRFENISGPAIKVSAQLSLWFEGVQPRNLLVRDNQFVQAAAGRDKRKYGVIYFAQQDGDGNPAEVVDFVRMTGNTSEAVLKQ